MIIKIIAVISGLIIITKMILFIFSELNFIIKKFQKRCCKDSNIENLAPIVEKFDYNNGIWDSKYLALYVDYGLNKNGLRRLYNFTLKVNNCDSQLENFYNNHNKQYEKGILYNKQYEYKIILPPTIIKLTKRGIIRGYKIEKSKYLKEYLHSLKLKKSKPLVMFLRYMWIYFDKTVENFNYFGKMKNK